MKKIIGFLLNALPQFLSKMMLMYRAICNQALCAFYLGFVKLNGIRSFFATACCNLDS